MRAGYADADGHAERVLRHIDGADQTGAAAGEDCARTQLALLSRVFDLARNQAENFVEPLLDDVRDQFSRDLPARARTRTRQLDRFARIYQLSEGDAVPLLGLLRF